MIELPPGWAWTTLGEIGDYLNGRGFRKHEWSDSGRPIIRIQNLTGTSSHFNYYKGEADESYVARRGDLLVSWAATLGAYVWDGPEAVVNQHIFKVRSFIDTRFHRYLVTSVLDELQRRAHGSGMVHVTRKVFDETHVALPPLAEQRRIVAAVEQHLSRLDAAVELIGSASARLANLRAAAIDSAFVASWPRVPLAEIAEIVGGVTKDAKRQTDDDPDLIEVPYLRVANVQRGFLDLRTVTTIRVPSETVAKLELRSGDVLFNEGGDRDKLGRGWVWSGQIPRCIHQNHVFRARLRDGFEPRFVSWWGNSFGREWFWSHGRQTTNLASMSLSTLKAFPVPAPPLDKQHAAVDEIERRLSAIDHLDQVVGASQARAATLRRSILARAFRGELVPQDTNDPPASVLLNRIAAERTASSAPARKRRLRTPA